SKRLPELEDLFVAQKHVAPRLEIESLANASLRDRLTNGQAMLGLDEGNVVDDEHPPLLDRGELVDDTLGRGQPVAAAVKCPCTAERTIPGTAAREFDRGRRIENADEILVPMTKEVARGQELVEVVDEARRRPLAGRGHRARHFCDGITVATD